MLLNLVIFFLFFFHFKCIKKYSIDYRGKNIITIKLNPPIGNCSSIAIIEAGSYIRYKSDSSIISSKYFENLNWPSTISYSKSFISQYEDKKIILTRGDKHIYKITLTESEDITTQKEELTSEFYSSVSIFSLQCNNEYHKYIITAKTELSSQYDSTKNILSFSSPDNSIKYSSCFFVGESNILCIKVFSSKTKYVDYLLSEL